MTEIFQTVLNMSITGAYISAAVILLRLCMKKLPRKYSYMLWSILGIRLLCPISLSSAVSVFNIFQPSVTGGEMTYIPRNVALADVPAVNVGIPAVNDAVNSALPAADIADSANPMQIILLAAAVIWLIGAAAMLAYSVISYLAVKKRVRSSALLRENVYLCGNIETPFVYGIIKPKIYIPTSVSEADLSYILAHERAHIRRGDHIVKLLALAALTVHWFNPLVWISFKLMSNDMELSCDERALKGFDGDVKKEYASALLNISMKQNNLSYGGLLAFGESNIKSRIKGVLSSKKPTVIVTAAAVLAVIIAAVCLLTNADTAEKQGDSLLRSLSYSNELYSLNRAGIEREFTQAEVQPLLDKLAATADSRVDGEKLTYSDGGYNLTLTMYPKKDNRADFIALAFISALDENGKGIFCVGLTNTNSYQIYEMSERDWFEISDIYGTCYDRNLDGLQTTAPAVSEPAPADDRNNNSNSDGLQTTVPAVSEPVSTETAVPEIPALNLIDCYINAEGEYFINPDEWQQSDDYALFKQYFFGAWEISSSVPYESIFQQMVIDDSEKSFFMTQYEYGFKQFYKVSENVLAFLISGSGEAVYFWLDVGNPDVMYADAYNGFLFNYSYSEHQKPETYIKTSAEPNEPAENFLGIFKLREMSQSYGIDYDMLVKLEYQCETVELALPLLHDDHYQLFPVYLVSEAPDKLTLKTSVGNLYYRAVLGDVTYTLEKIDGQWTRTVEFGFTEDEMSCMITADCAAEAYLQTNRDTLARYLVSGYEALDDSTEYLYSRVSSMNLRLPEISTAENDAVYTVTCELMLDGSDMLSYLDMELIKTADGWRVSSIALQG